MNEDWAALADSEIMTSFFKQELIKESQIKPEVKVEIDEDQVVEDLMKFEETVKSNPKLSQVFKGLQAKFASDPEFVKQCDQAFVKAVMILDLGE